MSVSETIKVVCLWEERVQFHVDHNEESLVPVVSRDPRERFWQTVKTVVVFFFLPASCREWSFCLLFHLSWRKITGLITFGWLHPSFCPFFPLVFLYKEQLKIPTFTRNGQECLWVTWAGQLLEAAWSDVRIVEAWVLKGNLQGCLLWKSDIHRTH